MAIQHPPIDFEWLTGVHSSKRLRLKTGVGLEGIVHLNGSGEDLVSELIRLARIGQTTERRNMGL